MRPCCTLRVHRVLLRVARPSATVAPVRMHLLNTRKASATSLQMRTPGVEPGSQAWEACMMPLHYVRHEHHGAVQPLLRATAPLHRAHHVMVWKTSMAQERTSDCAEASARCMLEDPPRKTHADQQKVEASRFHQHQWSSGRIHRCHRCDPGSIPG